MKFHQFVNEIKRRGVYRTVVVYAAAAWALLQMADVLFPLAGFPDWSITAVLVAAAAGFPVVVVMSWVFDLVPGSDEPPAKAAVASGHDRNFWVQVVQITVLLLLVALVGYLYLERLSGTHRAPAPADPTSIAVMPFVNLSSDAEMEYLGDGLAEEILNLLARLTELNVAARTSSFYFKGRGVDIQAIGQRLGVGHVLEGSVRRAGDKVRVTAQLIRSENGFHVWSQTYDRQVSDIFLIQDEIAAEVVDQLQLLLSADSQKLLERSSRVDPVAYDYYLRGRAYLRNPPDESNLRFAAELFGKAIAANADFSHAYAGQCDALLGLYEIDLETTHFSAAEASCEKALRLDRRAAAVYIALGNLYLTSGQYAQAEEEFKLALSLGSMTAEANLGLGDVYLVEGRYPQARRRYQNALDLQPRYWRALMRMAGFLLETGRVEQAVPYYVTVAELMPDSDLALNNLGVAYFMLGEFEQASAAWRKSLALAPSALTYSNMATVLFMLGNFDEALSLYHQAVELAPGSYELWGNLADTYRQLDGGRELAAPMYRNAIKLADKHLEVNAADAEALVLVAHYLAALGERDRALGNIGRAKKIAADNMYVSYVEATVHVSLGDDQRALAALETALAAGYPPHMAAADANLGELRSTPGFEALIRRPGVSAAN